MASKDISPPLDPPPRHTEATDGFSRALCEASEWPASCIILHLLNLASRVGIRFTVCIWAGVSLNDWGQTKPECVLRLREQSVQTNVSHPA